MQDAQDIARPRVSAPQSTAATDRSLATDDDAVTSDDADQSAETASAAEGASIVTRFSHLNPYVRGSVILAINDALRHLPARRAYVAAGMPDFDAEVESAERRRERTFPRLQQATDALVAAFHSDAPDAPPAKASDATISAFATAFADTVANNEDETEALRDRTRQRLRGRNDAALPQDNLLPLLGFAMPDEALFTAGRVRLGDLFFAARAIRQSIRHIPPGERQGVLGTARYTGEPQDLRHSQPRPAPEDLFGATPETLPSAIFFAGPQRSRSRTDMLHYRRDMLRQWGRTMALFSVLARELHAAENASGAASTEKARRNFGATWREILKRWGFHSSSGALPWPVTHFEDLSMAPIHSDWGAATVIEGSIRQRDVLIPEFPQQARLRNDWMRGSPLSAADATAVLQRFGTLDCHREESLETWLSGMERNQMGFPPMLTSPLDMPALIARFLFDRRLTPTRRRLLLDFAGTIDRVFDFFMAGRFDDLRGGGGLSDDERRATYDFTVDWKRDHRHVTGHDVEALLFSSRVTDAALRTMLERPTLIERISALLQATLTAQA